MNDRRTILSDCRKYRYALWREWPATTNAALLVVGLNPSTADETKDDATIRRCVRFAKDWGFGALCMANLFAYRARDPREMKLQKDPVGELNDFWLLSLAGECKFVLAAWGNHGRHCDRDADVFSKISNWRCLGTNRNGSPRHPLFVSASAQPVAFVR